MNYQALVCYGCMVHRRGVGFVNYVDQASAVRALQQLHGTRTPEGRQLHITMQAPRAVRAAAAAANATTQRQDTSPTQAMAPNHLLLSSVDAGNLGNLLASLQVSQNNNNQNINLARLCYTQGPTSM